MEYNIDNIKNEDAEFLLKTFKDGGYICDQSDKINGISRGKGIIFIDKGVCTIKYENGDIEKSKHPFFYLKK